MVKIRVENTDTEETLSSSERTAANAYERNRRDLKEVLENKLKVTKGAL